MRLLIVSPSLPPPPPPHPPADRCNRRQEEAASSSTSNKRYNIRNGWNDRQWDREPALNQVQQNVISLLVLYCHIMCLVCSCCVSCWSVWLRNTCLCVLSTGFELSHLITIRSCFKINPFTDWQKPSYFLQLYCWILVHHVSHPEAPCLGSREAIRANYNISHVGLYSLDCRLTVSNLLMHGIEQFIITDHALVTACDH